MASKTPAAKAAPAKATPVKKTSTAVAIAKPKGAVSTISAADLADKLRAQAAATAGMTQPPSGIKIQVTQDKKFKLPNGETVTELVACIVDFRTVHNFYEGNYDPKNIVPPVCFAVGPNPKIMAPVEDSPQLQAENCQVCPQNQFGSATSGNGKACKNGRRLALLPPTDDGADVDAEADMWLLDVSPTALRAWDGYVQGLSRTHQMPPKAFLTTISFNEAQTYPQLAFSDPVAIDSVGAVMEREEEAAEMLEVKPDWSALEDKPAAPARKAKPMARPVAKVPARTGKAVAAGNKR